MIRSSPVTCHLVPAVAAGLAVLTLAAPPAAAQAQGKRLPTELWEQYPLDPTPAEEEPDPTPAEEEPAEESPPPATNREEPAAPQGGGAGPIEAQEEGTPWLLLVAVTLAVLGVAVGFVLARRQGITDRPLALDAVAVRAAAGRGVRSVVSFAAIPFRAVSAATRWRPSGDVVERLHSEAGWLAPFAERPAARTAPSTRRRPTRAKPESPGRAKRPPPPPTRPPSSERKKVVQPGASPPNKGLPGLSAPKKEKLGTRGLPPGKRIPREESLPLPSVIGDAPAGEAPATPSARQPAALSPATQLGWEECQIEYWRTRSISGSLSDFYALAVRPDGETYIAAVSEPFKWGSGSPPDQTVEKVEAHAGIVALLLQAGWEPTGVGTAWYQQRFRRQLTARPERGQVRA